jgi:hypothetical protein
LDAANDRSSSRDIHYNHKTSWCCFALRNSEDLPLQQSSNANKQASTINYKHPIMAQDVLHALQALRYQIIGKHIPTLNSLKI